MIEQFLLKRGVYEPCSDIPPNWMDMRSEFGYTEVIRNRLRDTKHLKSRSN
jgi:hypothetical protein